jgi:2-iminobutanoate/2-iminopropanoate deaminase
VVEQARAAFANVWAVLKAAGFTREEIVFIDLAFADLADLAAITPYYDSLFESRRKPARTIYQAAALPYGAKIKPKIVNRIDNFALRVDES